MQSSQRVLGNFINIRYQVSTLVQIWIQRKKQWKVVQMKCCGRLWRPTRNNLNSFNCALMCNFPEGNLPPSTYFLPSSSKRMRWRGDRFLFRFLSSIAPASRVALFFRVLPFDAELMSHLYIWLKSPRGLFNDFGNLYLFKQQQSNFKHYWMIPIFSDDGWGTFT